MKKANLTLIVLLIGMLIISCSTTEDASVETVEKVISVKAQLIKTEDIQITKTFTGSLEGEKQAVIYSKIAEAVDKVNVNEGDKVNAQQIIIELDESGPSSGMQQAFSLFKNAEKSYLKKEYLYKEGAVSETEFDAAKTQYEVNKAMYEAASQLVNIETPIAGLVTSLNVADGDFVQIGQKLATVATSDKLRVRFNVSASDVKYLKEGAVVKIISDIIDNEADGKVIGIASSADPMTRAFEGEAIFENDNSEFKPGMFVRVGFIEDTKEDVIVISRKSILTLDNIETVFVAVNGSAEKREIILGIDVNGKVIVESGLNVNDTLITLGQDYLSSGTKINISELIEG